MKPRVALVTRHTRGSSSVPRVVREHVRRLHRDVDVVLVSYTLADELRPLVADWRRVPMLGRSRAARRWWFFLAAPLVFRRARADLVHAHGALVAAHVDVLSLHFSWAGHFRAHSGRRLDQNPIAFRLARALYVRVERWCVQRRATIVAVSSAGAEREVKQLFPDVTVAVTPTGVDLDRFRPDPRARNAVRAGHGIGGEEVVALFVGLLLPHFGSQKGLPVAIEGVARARELSGTPLRLWILTRADPEPFRALARRLGVGDHVEVLGFTEEPEHVFQAADIFVLPTLLEMFSLAACEAAACGLPLVTTRVPGMDELLGDGESGIAVRSDPDEVGAALARLASDPALRTRMGAAARERASRYTWDNSAASVLELYRRVLREA